MQNFEVQISGFNGQPVKFNMFNLLQYKHALSLEMKGLQLSRGKASTHLKKLLGCPRSYKVADLHKYVCDCIDDINKQLGVA